MEPKLFTSLNQARCVLQRVRGVPKDSRPDIVSKRSTQLEGVALSIPEGLRQGRDAYRLPLPAKVLLVSDLHVPYHDAQALRLALKTGVEQGCDTFYLNGDGLDFYGLSRFVKDPRARRPKEEIRTMQDIMTQVERLFKRRVYKCGNHDERWQIALFQGAGWLAEFAEFEFPAVMGFAERGWDFVESKQRAEFGHLHVLHGHEATRGLAAPVNPARGVWLKVKATCAVGHWHQVSQHTENMALDRRVVASWSTGCLCDLSPEYAPINNWAHGFAIVDVQRDGNFAFQNYRIIEGKVYPA